MFSCFQHSFDVVVDTPGVLQELDSNFCEFSLVSSFYGQFWLTHVAFFNWKKHPFYFKLLILLCGDIHLNSAPAEFLCGKCEYTVSDQDKALCCDDCDKWMHVSCENNILEALYDFMVSIL